MLTNECTKSTTFVTDHMLTEDKWNEIQIKRFIIFISITVCEFQLISDYIMKYILIIRYNLLTYLT
ncbi:hypothetical protein SDC9_133883 [bioreactor metagenome]|uniref:Uncharacterized protein n=1 Tax=bioreactor metagenome TaxID=1076179 RepID=A0A645DBU4_9ZZZZ